MHDEVVLEKIIQSIPKLPTEVGIIEIGAGLGDLTNKLLGLGSVTTYEVDTALIPLLEQRFSHALKEGWLRLFVADVLDVWKPNLSQAPYFLVANLPYYIATRLVIKAIKDPFCQGLVVMTQKEVAQKFCASVGDRNFSALSVLAQSVGEIGMVFDVQPSSFSPAPKVLSCVLRLQKRNFYSFSFFEQLEQLLGIAFASPRRTLLNNLQKHYDKQTILQHFQEANIGLSMRPHEIDTAHYHQLLTIL